jgi:hypothetical protein
MEIEQVLQSIYNEYGPVIMIIIALSFFLTIVWRNRLHEADKAKFTKDNELLKDELEKNRNKIEHFHQIL